MSAKQESLIQVQTLIESAAHLLSIARIKLVDSPTFINELTKAENEVVKLNLRAKQLIDYKQDKE